MRVWQPVGEAGEEDAGEHRVPDNDQRRVRTMPPINWNWVQERLAYWQSAPSTPEGKEHTVQILKPPRTTKTVPCQARVRAHAVARAPYHVRRVVGVSVAPHAHSWMVRTFL